MIVPVFTPASKIDASNVAEFSRTVSEYVDRYGCMVIDCSEVDWITSVGMHVLEIASHDALIAIVNPNPAVHLMAATFGGDVQCSYDRMSTPVPEPALPRRRLMSVPTDGRVAS
jgi:hypothetical protein